MFSFIHKSLLFGALFLSLVLSQTAYASFLLSINPIDGGTGIRFERVIAGSKNVKQLQVRISSNNGNKYQVFQRVMEPITNERGESLNLSAISMATLPSSNASGTLYLQNADHLGYSEQLLYTSGQNGESDSFMIAYDVSPEMINGSGTYRGKMLLTVRGMGSSDQAETLVDFTLENDAQLQASVVGGHDLKRISIKDGDTSQEKADFAKITFSNNGSQEIKIYQEFVSLPTNQTGLELPMDALRESVEGSSSNVRNIEGSELPRNRTLIYSGSIDKDDFVVYFLADAQKMLQVDSGTYRGQVKYTVEVNQRHQEFILDLECEIQPIFTIDVAIPAEGVSFGHVLPSSPSQEKQAQVTVHSNLHKPYQVMQNLASLMTNKQGKEFKKEHFTFKVDLAPDQKGQTKYTDFSPVEVGEYPIYVSDAQGSSVTFSVDYQLQGYFDMSPGDFVAPLRYSLNQN